MKVSMASAYQSFHNEQMEKEVDLDSFDDLSETDYSLHPRGTIEIQTSSRGQTYRHTYSIDFIYRWVIEQKNFSDPNTRINITQFDRQRIIFYKRAFDLYPELTKSSLEMLKPKLINQLKAYMDGSRLSPQSFNTLADFMHYFFESDDYLVIFHADLNRESSVKILSEASLETFLLRKSASAIDTSTMKNYVMSKVVLKQNKRKYIHFLLSHEFGRGIIQKSGSAKNGFKKEDFIPSILSFIGKGDHKLGLKRIHDHLLMVSL